MKAKVASNDIHKPKIGKKAKENLNYIDKNIKKGKNVQSVNKNVAKENAKSKMNKILNAITTENDIPKPNIGKKNKENEKSVVQNVKKGKNVQSVKKNVTNENGKANKTTKVKPDANGKNKPGKQNKSEKSEDNNFPKLPLKRKAEEEKEIEVNTQEEEVVKPNIPNETILKAKAAIKKLDEIAREKKNQLFDEETKLIMQLDCIKIPSCPPRVLRLKLPHWLLTETSDVCLFVSDLKKGKKIDHEPTIQHYEDLLRSKGVTKVKTVMSTRQVKVEYSQAEMKRRLLTQYEFFLADGKISKMLSQKLGRKFFIKNQLPIPVNMNKDDLKGEIDRALHKTPLPIHGNGTTFTLRVANMQHSDKQVIENVQAILTQVAEQFPGGWKNIRSVHLKAPLSMAIPIYVTLKNKNDVNKIVIKSPHSNNKAVEGEVDTITNGIVKVWPSGKVEVIKTNNTESDESDNEDASDKEELNSQNIPKKKAKLDSKTKKQKADKKPADELSSEQNAEDDRYINKPFQQNGNATDEQSGNDSQDEEDDNENGSEKDDEMDSNDDSEDDGDDDDDDDDDE